VAVDIRLPRGIPATLPNDVGSVDDGSVNGSADPAE